MPDRNDANSKLRKAAEQTIEQAMKAGCQGCDVVAGSGDSISLSAQGGEIDKYKVSSSNVLGLRVIKNNKVGIAYSEALDDTSLKAMVEQALAVSVYSGEDPHQEITHKVSEPMLSSRRDIYQDDTTSIEEKTALTLELESKALERDQKVKNCPYNGYADGESYSIYLNHLGTFGEHRERAFSAYTSVLAEADGKQAMFSHAMSTRKFSELDVDTCVEKSVEHAIPLLQGKPIKTGRYAVVFDIEQFEALFHCFSHSFSAKSAKEGKSRFKDKINEVVFHPELSLTDCPQFEEGFYYSAFDDEGITRKDLNLVEDGVLRNFYHNTATANYFKTKTTAHAARSPRGGLGVSGTHLVFKPGSTADEAVAQGTYLKIIGLKGLHSGTNAISGQFSLAVDAILMQDGEPQTYVREVTLSGNFYEMIKGIEAVGNQVHANASKTFFAPAIRFAPLSLAGN